MYWASMSRDRSLRELERPHDFEDVPHLTRYKACLVYLCDVLSLIPYSLYFYHSYSVACLLPW